MKKTVRNSNHELLRIVAMYMIIFIHANMYLNNFCTGIVRDICNGMVNGICNIGVSCFILISGYYGVTFDIKKFVKMECMMITYSLLETAVLCIAMPEAMHGVVLLEQLVKSFLPFISRKYWFYSSYVCLLFLSGYLHRLIEGMEREEFRRLLILMLVLFSVLPTFFYFELVPDNGKGLVQMVMVYMAGRYIKRYRDVRICRKAGLLFFVLWIVNGFSHEFPIRIGGISHHLCKDNSITNLIMAVILFYAFKELNFQSGIINKAAGYVFGVFALNNSLVLVVMGYLTGGGSVKAGGIGGFLLLAAVVFAVLTACLSAGVFREIVFGRMDRRIGEAVCGIVEKAKRAVQ